MEQWQERTGRLLGERALERLAQARVAVLGLGGVGSAAAEALGRCGVGHLLLVDRDRVDPTNLNRQLVATCQTVGQPKAQAMAQRLRSINPEGEFIPLQAFYLPEQSGFLYDWEPQVVLDAVDNVTAKLHLVERCQELGLPLLTCLGTGNRLDPSQLRVGDLAQTAQGCGCGLARVIRRELRRRGIFHQPVVYSLETPRPVEGRAPASSPFVPPAAGMLMASWAVKRLLEGELK